MKTDPRAVLLALAALAVAPAAAAQGSFGLFGGQFLVESEVESDNRLDVVGLRGGWELGDAPDDRLTAHLGTGVEIGLGRRWVLRPDVRLRWIDDGSDDVHTEATIGLGVRF